MSKSSLGDQELAVLRFVAEGGPQTAADVARSFGVRAGLARSTVLTVMERLRKKGYLVRKASDTGFLYRSKATSEALLTAAVGSFIDKTLAGALSPFVAYLAERSDISKSELAQLQSIVARMRREEKNQGDDHD